MPGTVTVEISGPDYHRSAVAVAQKLSVKSISELNILPGDGTPQLESLLPAVQYLRNYFHPQGLILVLIAGLSDLYFANLKGASGGINVVTPFVMQMKADDQKQQMERWKILQDTQTKIFEIQQDVTVNKARTQEKAFNRWDEYIRG